MSTIKAGASKLRIGDENIGERPISTLPFSLRFARPFFFILDLSKTWGENAENALNPEVFTEPGESPVAPLEVLKGFSLYDADISSTDKLSMLDHSLQYTLLKSLQAIPQVRSKASVALI